MDAPNNVKNQGAAEAAPSPLWKRALDVSDFGPCYQAIDVDGHFHAVHVVVAMKDGDTIEPLPAGQERVDLIIRACSSYNEFVAALKAYAKNMEDGTPNIAMAALKAAQVKL